MVQEQDSPMLINGSKSPYKKGMVKKVDSTSPVTTPAKSNISFVGSNKSPLHKSISTSPYSGEGQDVAAQVGRLISPGSPSEQPKEIDCAGNDKVNSDNPLNTAEVENDSVTESDEHSYNLLNGLPVFTENDIFAERFKIFERASWVDAHGACYFCTDVDNEQVELTVRIDRKDNKNTVLKTEYKVLKQAEREGRHGSFYQIHSLGTYDEFVFMASYWKAGPSLKSITKFMGNRKFTHGTVGRFASDIFAILQSVHSYGYLMHCIYMERLTFDACSRSLFLNDLTSLKLDDSRSRPPPKNPYRNPPVWSGDPTYAPFHFLEVDEFPPPPGPLARDELEAALYLILDLIKGGLPWSEVRLSEILPLKREALHSEHIFEGLPDQYRELWFAIRDSKEYDARVYPKLMDICKDIYHKCGAVKNVDNNFDFEIEPKAEDIPRFVLEKKPIVPDETTK
uniref:Protein kinase domain-containing protein n=1 Tax=Rhabditophanes sp. KR3021 TaxID=114890 RepID=A0AC35UGK2_9BILA